MTQALLIVDMQNDFLKGGSLEVPLSSHLISYMNRLIPQFSIVVASLDWHPADHCSFIQQGGRWPSHCIENSKGSRFPDGIDSSRFDKIFFKGSLKHEDSYSAFYIGEHNQSTGLDEFFQDKGVKEIIIVGLTLEYCVRSTALDALKLGYHVKIIKEAVAPLDKKLESNILKELKQKGVEIVDYKTFII